MFYKMNNVVDRQQNYVCGNCESGIEPEFVFTNNKSIVRCIECKFESTHRVVTIDSTGTKIKFV